MVKNRAYGRIIWRNDILGFQMVNSEGQQFFIYADPLISVYNNPDRYVRIKRKDSQPNKHAGYHSGEIYGRIKSFKRTTKKTTNKPKSLEIWYTRLTLYFGPAEKNLKLDEDNTELLDVIDEQKYVFPKQELEIYVKSMETMRTQNENFKLLMRNTDVLFRL